MQRENVSQAAARIGREAIENCFTVRPSCCLFSLSFRFASAW
jgi:hypothetical protein